MATRQRVPAQEASAGIKLVPQDPGDRRRIRALAERVAADLPRCCPPARDLLAEFGARALAALELPLDYLGFAMVEVSNAFWRAPYEAVPLDRRLLLLPKCLRDPDACVGRFDAVGLHCAGCGACIIKDLTARARALGYEVIVAEGTSAVIMKVLDGAADAILGVACLDSLDESFEPITELGVPNQALPLLRAGCERTETEPERLLELLTAVRAPGSAGPAAATYRTAVPLLRETRRGFAAEHLEAVLAPYVADAALAAEPSAGPLDAAVETEVLGVDWLRAGGKRFRPFVTVASYALGVHGAAALRADAPTAVMVPPAVRALAVAIEALHKASLAHDDIADEDAYRYGRPTLQRSHGVGVALNVGDWLVGLGYRLIAAQAPALGPESVADILARLAAAQLALCRGQGAELAWATRALGSLRAPAALQIGALKTAPAFEVAFYAGLRASGAEFDEGFLRRFATHLGAAYQVRNDLDDWRADDANKVALGQDARRGRPTILRAFAVEAGAADRLARAAADADVDAVRRLYEETDAFARAQELEQRLRGRCLALAAEARPDTLGELLRFVVRTVLRERRATAGGG